MGIANNTILARPASAGASPLTTQTHSPPTLLSAYVPRAAQASPSTSRRRCYGAALKVHRTNRGETMNLNGAGALVTGASSGIGLATAKALSTRGARLALVGRDRRRLAELAAEVGGTAIVADLTDDASITRCVEESAAQLGAIDILVNNAGVGWTGAFAHMPVTDIDHLIRLNLRAAILLARELTPPMIDRGRGHIVNVASIAGHLGVGGETVYSATKAALINFSEGLRQEVAGSGVGVTVVSPGVVATEFFNRQGAPYSRSWPRPITPQKVAQVIVRSIETGQSEAIVPKWLGIVAWLKGGLPGLYRALNRRFG